MKAERELDIGISENILAMQDKGDIRTETAARHLRRQLRQF